MDYPKKSDRRHESGKNKVSDSLKRTAPCSSTLSRYVNEKPREGPWNSLGKEKSSKRVDASAPAKL